MGGNYSDSCSGSYTGDQICGCINKVWVCVNWSCPDYCPRPSPKPGAKCKIDPVKAQVMKGACYYASMTLCHCKAGKISCN